MALISRFNLLPEEDVLDDEDDDDVADPTVPGDLWFRLSQCETRRSARMCVVYSPLVRGTPTAAAGEP